jgi:hypothetical protein
MQNPALFISIARMHREHPRLGQSLDTF